MGRKSVATIDSPEFLNITSISPKISKCEIKVLYIGQNRNRSCITKEVATKMAETLRGVPIVGYWCESKEDFLDHGEQVIIDGEGIKFKDMTKPYGFVAPDSKIWFQKFDDTDDFGNTITREYLMTEGYLWTEQYEECKRVMEEGNPQSMKLDGKNMKGFWSTDNNKGIDFFIINDAMFENLCILGEEVEPCFEGANITAPNLSSKFNLDETFTVTLFSMMNELKDVLTSFNEGGSLSMDENTNVVQTEDLGTTEEFAAADSALATEDQSQSATEPIVPETTSEEFKKKEEEDENKNTNEDDSKSEDKPSDDEDKKSSEAGSDDKGQEEEDDEKKKKKFELLENEFNALKSEYEELKSQYSALVEFKNQIDNEKKDEMINRFYMLSDEDKADVIANKEKYSLDEIEAKLSVICVRKKVNFDLESNDKNDNTLEGMTTFNVNSLNVDNSAPEWVEAMRAVKQKEQWS